MALCALPRWGAASRDWRVDSKRWRAPSSCGSRLWGEEGGGEFKNKAMRMSEGWGGGREGRGEIERH
jgi:hypothetical protein